MGVNVEFFGIPRERVGAATIEVEATTLGAALDAVGRRFPQFAASCLTDGNLAHGYLANINGRRFTTDPATPLDSGDEVMILSADVGG